MEERQFIPRVDVEKAAAEIMGFIDREKMNHVDYAYTKIEMWPSPEDPLLSECGQFVKQWDELFEYADTVTDDDGNGFPNETVLKFEEELKKVETRVNEDTPFWSKLRSVIMPLYDRAKDRKFNTGGRWDSSEVDWEERWRSIKLWYDPIAMQVQSTKLMRNVVTSEIVSRQTVSSRIIPTGFVIDIL